MNEVGRGAGEHMCQCSYGCTSAHDSSALTVRRKTLKSEKSVVYVGCAYCPETSLRTDADFVLVRRDETQPDHPYLYWHVGLNGPHS